MNRPSDLLPASVAIDAVFTSNMLKEILSESLLDPLADFFRRPGKNIRSQLVELGYRLAGAEGPRGPEAVVLALLRQGGQIVELIHGGSLIVDDIQDGSEVRRNGPSLHVAHGVPVALNAGNWLYFWALTQIRTLNLSRMARRDLTEDIIALMMKAHAGQALDIGTRIDLMRRDDVFEAALAAMELKTGTLLSLALRIGAGVRGTGQNREALELLGPQLGVLLQMYDDLGNLLRPSPKQYEDLLCRRPTWVWAVASTLGARAFDEFKDCVQELPDDRALEAWLRRHRFGAVLRTQTQLYRDLLEVSWNDEWKRTHPEALRMLLELTRTLELAYVPTP
jgi:geranylgeranyl pyrophosphate synthase